MSRVTRVSVVARRLVDTTLYGNTCNLTYNPVSLPHGFSCPLPCPSLAATSLQLCCGLLTQWARRNRVGHPSTMDVPRYPCDCPSSLNMWQVDSYKAPVARPHRPRRARWSQNDVWLDSRKNAWIATPGRISSVNGAVGPPRFLFRGVGALRTLVLQGTFQWVETLRTG